MWHIGSNASLLSSAPEAADSVIGKLMESPAPTKDATQLAQNLSSFTAWMEREREERERQIPGVPVGGKPGYVQRCRKPEIYRVTF